MVSVQWLTDAAVTFVSQYGYVALFLFILLICLTSPAVRAEDCFTPTP